MRALAVLAFTLVLLAVAAAAGSVEVSDKVVADTIADPTARLRAVGLPDRMPGSPALFKLALAKHFPHVFGATGFVSQHTPLASLNATARMEVQADFAKMAVWASALNDRGLPSDKLAMTLLKTDWECKACEFAVKEIKKYLGKGGCSLVGDVLGHICEAIPYIGPESVPLCEKILKWGCSKLVVWIENGVTSDTSLCQHVFHIC